jgi:hypothetical protein
LKIQATGLTFSFSSAAQNNYTFGVLMGLGQITEGLAAINNPSYFPIEGPFLNNGTTLADTSEASATVSNQTTTIITSAGNKSEITGGGGGANTTSGGGGGTDDPGSESDNHPSATLRS